MYDIYAIAMREYLGGCRPLLALVQQEEGKFQSLTEVSPHDLPPSFMRTMFDLA
jgi:hypothetical protein